MNRISRGIFFIFTFVFVSTGLLASGERPQGMPPARVDGIYGGAAGNQTFERKSLHVIRDIVERLADNTQDFGMRFDEFVLLLGDMRHKIASESIPSGSEHYKDISFYGSLRKQNNEGLVSSCALYPLMNSRIVNIATALNLTKQEPVTVVDSSTAWVGFSLDIAKLITLEQARALAGYITDWKAGAIFEIPYIPNNTTNMMVFVSSIAPRIQSLCMLFVDILTNRCTFFSGSDGGFSRDQNGRSARYINLILNDIIEFSKGGLGDFRCEFIFLEEHLNQKPENLARILCLLRDKKATDFSEASVTLVHSQPGKSVSINLEKAKEYFVKAMQSTDEKSIRFCIGSMHYYWACATPYGRGSAATGEWLSAALYKAKGITLPKLTVVSHIDQLAQSSLTRGEFIAQYLKLFA